MPRPERAIKGFPGCRTAYPELRALGYASVPDFRERTPWGSSSPGQYREAGLPNITGMISSEHGQHGLPRSTAAVSGAFYCGKQVNDGVYGTPNRTTAYQALFDASRSSGVYGRSSTVQPAAYTVRFLIRASN